ncbi:MAG: CDP-diacylglycerol--serine O-phosphatidyltransferase [Peptococcaceae bacterium]|jgi:CDP-diacylglycerol--serine O-phosphatidyltransferase|nr:CDP-diacylglycerol--serine O-phosphatidyltransferase [Peptococcaceae bacterium]
MGWGKWIPDKKHLIPNAVTMTNLALGFFSLVLTMHNFYHEAAYAVFGAALMDSLDGRLARRLQVVSDFGRELDSLSDLVSFGVSPALLVYSAEMYRWNYWGLLFSALFALCGAFRLARFNVAQPEAYFVGVPITFCGPALTLAVLLSGWLDVRVYPVLTLFLGYLMVCGLKVPKL